MSSISAVIDAKGESLAIKRRTQTGTDDYGKPIYTWATTATENIFLQPLNAQEISGLAGEYTPKDLKGFFKADSAVLEDDRVTWSSVDYEIKGLKIWKVSGSTKYLQAYLKRVS